MNKVLKLIETSLRHVLLWCHPELYSYVKTSKHKFQDLLQKIYRELTKKQLLADAEIPIKRDAASSA